MRISLALILFPDRCRGAHQRIEDPPNDVDEFYTLYGFAAQICEFYLGHKDVVFDESKY